MSRILEMTWLTLALCGLSISIWRFVLDGPTSAFWFLLLTLISVIFYSKRRKDRKEAQILIKNKTINPENEEPVQTN